MSKERSVVKLRNSRVSIEKGIQVYGENIKGRSNETYQVVNFKISSKKAAEIFEENSFGNQVFLSPQ